MEYYVADSYIGFDRVGEPFEKNGKLYTSLKCKCDRCHNGVFVCRVENNQPIPHPAYGGVCLKCQGTGWIYKEARLYTKAEYDTLQHNKEKATAKRKQEQEAKIKAEFAANKEKWLKENGFSAAGETYIVIGDSYSIKDKLKEAGFRFNGGLRRWVRATADGYENKVIKFNLDDLFEMSAWGKGVLLNDAKNRVDAAEKQLFPEHPSEWIGELGKRTSAIQVTLIKKYTFEGQYGYSTVYTFKDTNDNIMCWFTASNFSKEVGDVFTITAFVKDHTVYKNQKQTIINRVKIKE